MDFLILPSCASCFYYLLSATKEYFLHPEQSSRPSWVWKYVWMWLGHWRNVAIGRHQDRMSTDRLGGYVYIYSYIYVCVCVCVVGVVAVFTVSNEPIGRLPRGRCGGGLLGGWDGGGCTSSFLFQNVGHFPSSGGFLWGCLGTKTLLQPPPPLQTPLSNHLLINDAFN